MLSQAFKADFGVLGDLFDLCGHFEIQRFLFDKGPNILKTGLDASDGLDELILCSSFFPFHQLHCLGHISLDCDSFLQKFLLYVVRFVACFLPLVFGQLVSPIVISFVDPFDAVDDLGIDSLSRHFLIIIVDRLFLNKINRNRIESNPAPHFWSIRMINYYSH
jgi:hypothetical protein